MKKVYIALIALFSIALSYSFTFQSPFRGFGQPNQGHDASDPGWIWMSGDVKFNELAKWSAFKIRPGNQFNGGEKIKITFDSYKVTLGGLSSTTTFHKWTGHVNLVYYSGSKWLPLKDENNSEVDKIFSGMNNNASDSMRNYSFVVTLPKNKEIIMAIWPKSIEFDTISGNGHPMFANGQATIATTIKGMEIDKIK